MSDIDDPGPVKVAFVGACVLGVLVTGVVMLVPVLVLIRAAQIVREASGR